MKYTNAQLYPRHQVLAVLESRGHQIYQDGEPVSSEKAKEQVEVSAPTATPNEFQKAIEHLAETGTISDYDTPEWTRMNSMRSKNRTDRTKAQVQHARRTQR